MYSETLIKLIEDEYQELLGQCSVLKEENGFNMLEKPYYICEKVQRFRSWIKMAIRSSEVVSEGIPIKPEDAIIRAAISMSQSSPREPVHQDLINSLLLFDRRDLDGIIGEERRQSLEKATGINIENCSFELCQEQCEFLRKELMKLEREGSSL